jgi:hypothetical protein
MVRKGGNSASYKKNLRAKQLWERYLHKMWSAGFRNHNSCASPTCLFITPDEKIHKAKCKQSHGCSLFIRL